MNGDLQRFWNPLVRYLAPYVPGEQPQHPRLVKLNTNESPYPPGPAVMAALAAVSADDLRRYPDPDSSALRAAFAARYGLGSEQVFLGNGSDEVLAHVFLGLLQHGKPILFPDITYSFYPVWCQLYGIAHETVALDAQFRIEPSAYQRPCGGIIVPNPNAPTGCAMTLAAVRELLAAQPDRVVVIDEAYVDFGAESATALIASHPNLVVVQTLSKSMALAGLRVGAAFAQAHLIEALERVKNCFNSYPLDAVAQRVALAALGDTAWFDACRSRVVASREHLRLGLAALGFEVLPSAANFLLARRPAGDARALFHGLRARGVIVRYFDKPRIDDCLRITVGTEEQCEILLAELADLIGGTGTRATS